MVNSPFIKLLWPKGLLYLFLKLNVVKSTLSLEKGTGIGFLFWLDRPAACAIIRCSSPAAFEESGCFRLICRDGKHKNLKAVGNDLFYGIPCHFLIKRIFSHLL